MLLTITGTIRTHIAIVIGILVPIIILIHIVMVTHMATDTRTDSTDKFPLGGTMVITNGGSMNTEKIDR